MPSLKRIIGVNQTSPSNKPQKESYDPDVFSSSLHDKSTRHKNMEDKPSKKKNGEDRIAWLQSQLIGKGLEFETPFGKRRLTYADHTASGRCLKYIENYIIQEVLPFYGMILFFLSSDSFSIYTILVEAS